MGMPSHNTMKDMERPDDGPSLVDATAPPVWFSKLSPEVRANIQRFIKSIEEDTDGWCRETHLDLSYEFDLTAEQAQEIFRHLCVSEASRALFERMDAEARSEAAVVAARQRAAEVDARQRKIGRAHV